MPQSWDPRRNDPYDAPYQRARGGRAEAPMAAQRRARPPRGRATQDRRPRGAAPGGSPHFTEDTVRPRSHRRVRRRSWLQRLILGAGLTVVVLALLGVSAATFALVKYLGIERVSDLGIDASPAGAPRNYLVVGSDTRAGTEPSSEVEGQRSDTMMIVRVDPGAERAAVLSIPRDLVVPISGTGGTDRINSAYARGRATLIDTIRDDFDVEIHHYVEIDFAGFERLVDHVGGVPLWVGAAIKDTKSGLYVEDLGCVTLDGRQALAYVRSRQLQYITETGEWSRPDPSADLGRIERQQVFMRNAVSKAMARVKSNPTQIPQLVNIAVDSVAIDDRMSVRELLDLSKRFREFEPDTLLTYPLPVVERGDGATLAMDRAAAEPILNVFRGLDPGEITPGLITVTVLNGTGEPNQATDAAGAFQTIGFQIGQPSDAEEAPERTVVYHRPGEDAYGLRVARHITGGAGIAPRDDLGLDEGEVAVVTGSDFTTINREPTPLDQMPTTRPAGTEATPEESASEDAVASPAETSQANPDQGTTNTTTPPPPPPEPSIPEFVVGDLPSGADCG